MTEPEPRPARRQSRLRLRRPADIAWAFVLGPTAGLTVLFVLMLAVFVVGGVPAAARIARMSLAFFFIYLLLVGGLVCLLVELAVITPLLIAFHRYRWRWLNGWTGALIGFALAFIPTWLLLAFAPQGQHGAWSWLARIIASAVVGVVGLVAAGVFRLLAVERADAAGDALS
ncbi:MAG TPA: hypothetical protein VGF50_05620 [Caulobacteraceae bacterium]|jgi:hypothetical protein